MQQVVSGRRRHRRIRDSLRLGAPATLTALAVLALVRLGVTEAAPLECSLDFDDDGVADLVLQDADGNGRCELPAVVRRAGEEIRFTASTPVEFDGRTTIEADGIVIEAGGGLHSAPGARDLTLIGRRGIAIDGTLDVRTRDDVLIRVATGTLSITGAVAIDTGDTVTLKVAHGDLVLAPSSQGSGFDVFAGDRVTLLARGTAGSMDLAGVRIGARAIRLSTRASSGSRDAPLMRIRDGAFLTTEPAHTGLRDGGLLDVRAGGDLRIADAVLASRRTLALSTGRTRDLACLAGGTHLLVGSDDARLGQIDATGVDGLVFVEETVVLAGRMAGPVVHGACPATSTTETPTTTLAGTSLPSTAATMSPLSATSGSPAATDFVITSVGVDVAHTQLGDEVPLKFVVRNVSGRSLGRVPLDVRFDAAPGAPITIDPGTQEQRLLPIFSRTTTLQVRVKLRVSAGAAAGTYEVDGTFTAPTFQMRASAPVRVGTGSTTTTRVTATTTTTITLTPYEEACSKAGVLVPLVLPVQDECTAVVTAKVKAATKGQAELVLKEPADTGIKDDTVPIPAKRFPLELRIAKLGTKVLNPMLRARLSTDKTKVILTDGDTLPENVGADQWVTFGTTAGCKGWQFWGEFIAPKDAADDAAGNGELSVFQEQGRARLYVYQRNSHQESSCWYLYRGVTDDPPGINGGNGVLCFSTKPRTIQQPIPLRSIETSCSICAWDDNINLKPEWRTLKGADQLTVDSPAAEACWKCHGAGTVAVKQPFYNVIRTRDPKLQEINQKCAGSEGPPAGAHWVAPGTKWTNDELWGQTAHVDERSGCGGGGCHLTGFIQAGFERKDGTKVDLGESGFCRLVARPAFGPGGAMRGFRKPPPDECKTFAEELGCKAEQLCTTTSTTTKTSTTTTTRP